MNGIFASSRKNIIKYAKLTHTKCYFFQMAYSASYEVCIITIFTNELIVIFYILQDAGLEENVVTKSLYV